MRLLQEDADRMVKVVRHRLRNHISGLKTAIDLLESEMGQDREDLREYFPLLRKECMMVDDLSCRIGFALEDRMDGGSAEAFTVLDRVFDGIRKAFPSVTINSDCGEWSGVVMDHSMSTERCFYELIRNAAEASVGNEIDVKAGVHDGDMVFTVRDYGVRMSDDDFKNMKKPFYTTKSRHAGIGLNIADNFLKHKHGKLMIRRMKEPAGIEARAIFKCA